MTQNEELALLIETELNGNINSTSTSTVFKIWSTVGDYKNSVLNPAIINDKGISPNKIINDTKPIKYINGILRPSDGSYTPVKTLNSVDIDMTLEFAVPQEKVDIFLLIMDDWSSNVIAKVYPLDSWNLLITPSVPYAGTAANASPLGAYVPFMTDISVTQIKGGLISNSVVWKLNGQDIFPLTANIHTERVSEIKSKISDGLSTIFNATETLTFSLSLAYSFNNTIVALVNDILNRNFSAVYTLMRSDGLSDDKSYSVCLTTGNITEEAESGMIAGISCEFAVTESIVQGE